MKKITSLLLAFLVISLNACQEDDVTATDGKTGANIDVQWDDTKLSTYSQAPFLYEKIDEPYEDVGKVAYRFLKFREILDPVKLLDEQSQVEFEENYKVVRKRYAGLSTLQIVDKMKEEGLLPNHVHQFYREFFDNVLKKLNSTQSVEEVWNYLRDYEKRLINDPNLMGEKDIPLVFSSLLRNFIKIEYETELLMKEGEPIQPTARLCPLGINLGCWGQILGAAALGAVTAGIGTVASGAVASGIVWKAVLKAGVKSAATGFLKETVSAASKSKCSCKSSTPPACAAPEGIQVLFEGCSDIFGIKIIGGGTDPFYEYSIKEGVAIEYNNSELVRTDERFLWIKQLDKNKTVRINVRELCSSGSNFRLPAREFNPYALARDPQPYAFTGATYVPLGDTEAYYIYGVANARTGYTSVANSNSSFVFSSNYAGQDIQKGDNFIKVKWNIKTSSSGGYGGGYGGASATVYGNINNSCSGRSSNRYINVSVY